MSCHVIPCHSRPRGRAVATPHGCATRAAQRGGEEGSVGHEGRGAEHGFGEPRPHVSFISFVILVVDEGEIRGGLSACVYVCTCVCMCRVKGLINGCAHGCVGPATTVWLLW